MSGQQICNPFGNMIISTALAARPVAVMLICLDFSPLAASGLTLIANTASVALGTLGTPVITLAKVHGYDLAAVTAMIGTQLAFFSLLVPFWLIWAFAGRKGMMQLWPVVLLTALSFAIPEYLVSNYMGPELVGIISAIISMACLIGFLRTCWPVRYSLATIVLMLGLGTLTRYSGTDTTLGLAFANSGVLYPVFGTLMGWIGAAMTGSDTASNVLFGGMQKIAAAQLGLSANLMGAANNSGGVMGKMIDAQSIVVASTAARWFNHEGDILRFIIFHAIALACPVGVFVTLQAYVWPFTLMVIH